MTKTFFASAALLLATAAPAFADEKPTPISFQRDGETYTYTKTEKDGRMILNGHFSTGERFELTVRGDQVVGTVRGVYIAFSLPRAQVEPGVSAALATR